MTDRSDPVPPAESGPGGENFVPPEQHTHEGAPHDSEADEPLGPLTPDDETPLGATPEVHDELIPEDLPKDHPGRHEAERMRAEGGRVQSNT